MLGRRRTRGERVRLFFATDIHGSERCFRKWLNAAPAYGTSIVILGGDIAGKGVVPVLEDGGVWVADYLGSRYEAHDEAELEDLRQRIRRGGMYDVIVTPDELATLNEDQAEVELMLARAMSASLERWVELAEQRLGERGLIGFVMLGNDDPPELADVLAEGRLFVYAGEDVRELPGGLELLSCGYSTPTPWNSPRELSEEDLGARIEELAGRLMDPRRAIFNVHCPPRATALDQAPILDEQLRPTASVSGIKLGPVGSQSVREAIERHQPLLGLHGHVHESPGMEKLGATVCINPGSLYGQGLLRGTVVELEVGGEVRSWQLTEG